VLSLFESEKRTAAEIAAVVGADEVISHPQSVFAPDHLKNIVSSFAMPAVDVFVAHVRDEVGETALAASLAICMRYFRQ